MLKDYNYSQKYSCHDSTSGVFVASFNLSDKHFQTVVKTCAFESKCFVKNIIADKAETHSYNVTGHFINIHMFF